MDLTINYSNTGTDVITACDNYTWIDGNTYTSSNNPVNIYPNPTSGIIEISLVEDKVLKIRIFDMSGSKVIEKIPEAQNEKIDLSGFDNGLYIIMVETDKKIYTSKIIKE